MRNLVLILIAFIAVVTFIRAFDRPGNEAKEGEHKGITEFGLNREDLMPSDFESAGLGAEPGSPTFLQ
jgi:hypothetical protein